MNAEIDNFIERVRTRSDIYSVVSDYLSLKFKNGRFWAHCPFHEGEEESLTIAQNKGFFYCSHCHAGGDAVKFISMKENISYFEAAKRQAEKLKISLPLHKKSFIMPKLSQRKKTLFRINRLAREFYHRLLKKSDAGREGRKYLEKSGIAGNAIEEFKLGFAPKSSDELTELLLKKNFTSEQIVDSGLVLRQENSEKFTDRLHNRIVIPATNVFGRVVGIGGRILGAVAESGSTKFFDMPQTVAFNQNNFVFGVREPAHSLTVVNSCTDAIFLKSAGVESVAAVPNAILNENHLRFLLKYAKKIIFCREKEKIWQGDLAVAKNFEDAVFFVSMPQGQTVQAFVRKNGKEKFYEMVKNVLPSFDRRLQNVLNQNAHSSFEEKVETLKKIFQIIPGEKNADFSQEYLKKISVALDLDENKISEEWQKLHSPPPEKKVAEPAPSTIDKKSPEDYSFSHLCSSILRVCWQENDLLDLVLSMVPEENFSEIHREIINYIKKSLEEERRTELSQAQNELSEKAYAEIFQVYGDELSDEELRAFNDSVRTARRFCLQKKLDAKILELQQHLEKGEMDFHEKLTKETDKLRKEIDRLQ